MARRLIDDVRSIDTTRPVVMGSDKYRSVPAAGSPQDQILRMLDGLGLNYNTAGSVDALHAKYPDKFFFESETSSETSTRGAYQDPDQLNTGENYTPGKRATSSYDNNLASWTMSGEYGLKKDRDRKFFAGQFLWSGSDYIGEPTPYDVFPVKTSFFGAIDTAGFPKDQYYLFKSQWTSDADGPSRADGLDAPSSPARPCRCGRTPTSPASSCSSTGARSACGGSTARRRRSAGATSRPPRPRTTTRPSRRRAATRARTAAPGTLYLTWTCRSRAAGSWRWPAQGGRVVARDEVGSAGRPYAVRLRPERRAVARHGVGYVDADVVDRTASSSRTPTT